MNCPDCQSDFVKRATSCPGCGRKIPRFLRLGESLYLDTFTARRVVRVGKRWLYVKSHTMRGAKLERDKARTQFAEFRGGLRINPFPNQSDRLAALAQDWTAAGCPDRKLRPLGAKQLAQVQTALAKCLEFAKASGVEFCKDIEGAFSDRYHAWRIKHVKRAGATGHRSVDLELTVLANLLRWLLRTRKIDANPLATRPSFSHLSENRHANMCQPESDEELHRIANHFFDTRQSEVLGWQLLLEALTGCRTNEILRLRWDARKGSVGADPGYYDEYAIYVQRSKHGIFPYVLMHEPLSECLAALRAWRNELYPSSQWFLPGVDSSQAVGVGSLSHALRRVSKRWHLGSRTSHGLRAFHVRVLRSTGVDDSEIAKRLGLRTGVSLIEQVYGGMDPGWFGSKRLDFLPVGFPPAWSRWIQKPGSDIIQMPDKVFA